MQNIPVEMNITRRIESPVKESFASCAFLYVSEGEILISAGGEPILHSRPGPVFLPPGREVLLQSARDISSVLILGIGEAFLFDHLKASPLPFLSSALDLSHDYLPLTRSVLRVSELARYFDSAPADARTTARMSLMGEVFVLLAELSRLLPAQAGSAVPDRYKERVQEIADYIDLHYAENFSLPDLARVFYLTPQYLSTFFREHFQTNFKTYVTGKRLFYSLRDLRSTDLAVSEVALRNGFASVSAFQKNFQRTYHLTPSKYRAVSRGREGNEVLLPSGEDAAPQNPPDHCMVLRADAPPADLPRSNRMINAGSVQNLLSDRFRTHLLSFCREMKLGLVRIEELLSNSFMPMILPHYEYFYQSADIVLTFLYENRLVPFIELSKVSSPVLTELKGDQNFAFIPRNERFFRALDSFLKHVSRRWPVSWLSEWKFEMHMLPKDTPDSYADAFRRVRDIILSQIPGAKVGGPGLDPERSLLEAEPLLDELMKRSAKPDFFSVSLYYSGIRPDGSFSLCMDPDAPFEACGRIRRMLLGPSLKLPLYVTEWSSAPLLPAAITASLYQAAFLARAWTKLDSCSDLSAYYLYSDMERSSDTFPVISSFGRGLCGNDFIPYAACFAYAFCSRLGTTLLADRSSCRFVRAEENHYHLLVYHYLHIKAPADPAVEDITDFDRTYSFFGEAEPMTFRARVTGLVPGLYHTTLSVIDKEHGSILDVLIGEYTHSNIDPVEFLQHARNPSGPGRPYRIDACLPLERSTYRRVDTEMDIEARIPPHAVCLWDIRRLI